MIKWIQKKFYPLSFFQGVALPILLWLIFSFYSAELDLRVSHFFYVNGAFISHPFWDWIYIYALWPGWLMVSLATLGFFISFFSSQRQWWRPCLFLMLTLAIGSGLFIHLALKDQWGRPRPRQVTEFGGKQAFRPYYQPNIGNKIEPSKSFACGHASMGFYFFSLSLLGTIYRHRFLYGFGLGVGWILGGLLSFARLAQGGHFLSDVLASALIMWLTAWGLAYFFFVSSQKIK